MKKLSLATEAIFEITADQHRIRVMEDGSYRKITVRHLGAEATHTSEPISGEEIRTPREQANPSQAAFAMYLNLTAGYISQLERGTKQPKGPALTLLNLIRRRVLKPFSKALFVEFFPGANTRPFDAPASYESRISASLQQNHPKE